MSEPDLPEGAVEVARITIVKTFDDTAEGGMACEVGYSDQLCLLDALGMLAYATHVTPETYNADAEGDRT